MQGVPKGAKENMQDVQKGAKEGGPPAFQKAILYSILLTKTGLEREHSTAFIKIVNMRKTAADAIMKRKD